MSRNIVPRVDKGADLGTAEKNWNRLFVDAVVLRGDDLRALLNDKIGLNMLTAKGDILVATEPGVVTTLPAGASGYVLKSNPAAPEGLMWGPNGARQELTGDMTVTVGNTGDFPTINAALESVVALYYPKYISRDNCPRVTIQLLPGFVMKENVVVESLDLSWITITGIDDETTIIRGSIPTYGWVGGIGRSAFMVYNGGFLPIIAQLFYMDDSGDGAANGILAYKSSRAIVVPGCGVRNAGSTGICAEENSIINANGANVSDAGHHGIAAGNGSIINANGANASGAGTFGIFATRSSTINAEGANASGAGTCGIYADRGSTINAEGANASGAGNVGIFAAHGSLINADGADASNAGVNGFRVEAGGIINASGATGSTNVTPNTITSNGIIFQ